MTRYYLYAIADGHTVHQWAATADSCLKAFENSITAQMYKLPANCPVKVCIEIPHTGITVTFNIQIEGDDND